MLAGAVPADARSSVTRNLNVAVWLGAIEPPAVAVDPVPIRIRTVLSPGV